MAVQIQLRRDTAAQWNVENPLLAQGELGIETDTDRAKLGDGINTWTALGYWPSGASAGAVHFDPTFQEGASLSGKAIASFPLGFEQYWLSRRHGSWDALYKYLWWSFYCPNTSSWLPAAQYASYADMATALMTIVPNDGTNWGSATFIDIYTYDAVDHEDDYPKERHCRNSILACMKGNGNHLVRDRNERSGVAWQFNSSTYFSNYHNSLLQACVEKYTGVTPATNDDGAMWYTGGKRGGLWNFPKVGTAIEINGVGWRDAAWDTVAPYGWVNPAPMGGYVIQPPFFLHEPRHNRGLQIDYMTTPDALAYPTKGTAVAIHPVLAGSRYLAFVATAAGFDTWFTERVPPATHEHTARVRYRHESGDRVVVIPLHGGNDEKDMYIHFPYAGGDSYFFHEAAENMHIDSDTIPTKIQIARRNTTTGVRSPWVDLGVVKRRLVNIPLRLDPAYRK